MNTHKLFAMLLVLALLLSMLPATVQAQSEAIAIERPRVERKMARTASAGPTLAAGNHQSYLDRVDSVPNYALEYYHWLEENATPDGILVDPTKGDEYEGDYYYDANYVSGTAKFTFSSKNEILEIGGALVSERLEQEFATFNSWASTIQDIFDRDHPEVFWLSGQSSLSYLGSWSYSTRGTTCTVYYEADMVVWLQYAGFDIREEGYRNPQTIIKDMELRDSLVREILADCPDGSDYDRIAYLNDTLTARNAYNSAVASGKSNKAESSAWECISALAGTSGTAGPVCEGYARAFQILCTELGIPCVLVDGSAVSFRGDTPEDHMWNYVQIDGGWYAVDVTWNDPYVASMPDVKKSGYECQDWLLLGSNTEIEPGMTFAQSHMVTNCIRPGGLAYTNGPVLEEKAYNPDGEVTYSISGKAKSTGNGELTVQLSQDGSVVMTQSHNGSNMNYIFEGIVPGTYQLTVSKEGHVTYTKDLTVVTADLIHDVTLQITGDVSGDGRINVGDVARIYGYVKKASIVTDPYMLKCMDFTGDGRINVGDASRLYARMKGKV